MRAKSFVRARDALSQLQLDYQTIHELLQDFDRLRLVDRDGAVGKAEIVDGLCDILMLHAQIKEEIFYPVVRATLGDDPGVLSAFCNHSELYRLISQIDELDPRDPDYDELVGQLSDCVVPSIDQERAVVFTRVRGAGVDTAALGRAMARRRRAQQQAYTEQDLLEQRRA